MMEAHNEMTEADMSSEGTNSQNLGMLWPLSRYKVVCKKQTQYNNTETKSTA